MTLARMRVVDNDALICDFAQYYGIYDYMQLGREYAAILACGLPDESRIKRAISGQKAGPLTVLAAIMVDRLSTLVWFQTEDGHNGQNRPAMIAPALLGMDSGTATEEAFDSIEAFEAARARFLD